ncbi:hypothetical protein MMC10_000719 [Thelotrema lepadinum]|nr:hypothetical protein [Thelotrema lepadinum]
MKAIVDSIKQRYIDKDIVLICWHPHPRELPAIQALAPSLFQEFAGWADVVDVTQQICVSKQENLVKSWPPLSDVMLCVGFSEDCIPQRFIHSAGSDAIHTIIVLARLLTYDPDELPIEIRRRRPSKSSSSSNKKVLRRAIDVANNKFGAGYPASCLPILVYRLEKTASSEVIRLLHGAP